MIVSKSYSATNFVVCYGFANMCDTIDCDNISVGTFNQAVYVLKGSATANQTLTVSDGLNDLTQFFGKSTAFLVNSDVFEWVAINPIPSTKRYDIQEIKNAQHSVTGTTNEQAVVCVKGSVTVNGISLPETKYAKILDGVVANIDATNGICLLLTKES